MTGNNIGIKLSVSGDAQVRGALGNVERSMGGLQNAAAEAQKAIGPLMGVFTAGAALGKLVAVQREFDVLNSSLKTVTGSSAAAAREMEWIKAFAKETPFGLAQATQGFVKMKALGLDPSRAALTSFGNTASAMGKDLNQMIEAVADASTGEFERLKEFGVKAKKEGDNVSLTFQGVTTTIGNNAREITGYLEALGNNQFAGAMADRANTLDGAIASLGDTWDELFRTISQQNAGTLMHDAVRMAEGAVADLTTILGALNGTTAENARQTGAMATVQEGLAITFETAAVMGANVKYVLTQIGREMGVISAVYSNVLKFNWEGAKEVARQYHEESKNARAEIDATSDRILTARQRAGLSGPNNYDTEPVLIRARAAALAAETKARKEAADAAAAEEAARAKAAAAAKAGAADAKKAAEADLAWRRRYTLELVKDWDEAAKAEAAYQAALDARNFDEAWEADQKNLAAIDARIKAGRTMLEQLEFENSLLALNTTEREVANAMRELERQGVVAGTEAYTAYAAAVRKAVTDRESVKEATDFWKSIESTAKGVWTDVADSGVSAFERIGKTLKSAVLDMLWQMTGRQWLISVGTAMGVPGAAMAGQAGVQNPLGMMGSFESAYNAITTGIRTSFSAGFDKLVNNGVGERLGLSYYNGTGYETTGLGAQMGQTFAGLGSSATAYGIQKGLSGGYKTGESGLVDGLTAIGGFFDPTGGLIAGAIGGLVNRAFGRKLADQGLQGTFGGEAGFTGENFQFYKGGWFRSDKTKTSALDEDTQSGLAAQFKALQVSNALMATTLGASTAAVENFTSTIKISFNGLTEEQAAEKLTEQFTAMNESMAAAVLGTSEYTRNGETAAQALARLSSSLTTVNAISSTLGWALQDVGLAGANAASAMADAFGGLDAMAQSTSAYYANFYTEAERTATATQQLTTQLASMGLTLPATRDEWKGLVDAAIGRGDNSTAAKLISLSGAFASVTQSTDDLAAAATRAAEAAQREADEAAKAAQQAAQAMADALADAADYLANFGRTVQEWLDVQNATTGNPTQDLASAGAAFQRQLATAKTGDRNALGSITGYADRLLSAGEQRLGYIEGQQLLAQVKTQMADLPAQVSMEGLLKDIADNTAATASNTYGLDTLSRIKDVVDSLQWGTPEWDAASTKALATFAAQNGWTATDIATAIGRFTGQEIADFFAKYGSAIGVGGLGATTTTGTKPATPGGFVIGGTVGTGPATTPAGASTTTGNTYTGALGTVISDPYYVDRFDSINTYVNTLDWSSSNASQSAAALAAAAQQYGVSLNDIAIATGYQLGDIASLLGGYGLSFYAAGGAFTNGIAMGPTMFNAAMMGEAGPEAIMPLANIGGSLGVRYAGPDFSGFGRGMEAMAAEIKALRAQIARLESAATATAVHAADSADSLRNIKNNGVEVWNDPATPITTEAAA